MSLISPDRFFRPQHSSSLWMLTFSDLLTLLLTFFVLRISLNPLPQAQPTDAMPVITAEALDSANLKLKTPVPVPAPSAEFAPLSSEVLLKEYGLGNSDNFDTFLSQSTLYNSPGITVSGKDNTALVLFSKETFLPGSATLSFSAASALSALAKISAAGERKVRIVGFSDLSLINTAQYPSNWELSAARVQTAVRQMLDAGVDPSAITVAGYGNANSKMGQIYTGEDGNERRLEIYLEAKSPL